MYYSILIVDDEATIRQGIIQSIDWNKYEFEIIGEAADGEEALEKTKELKPDIIITDIKMPKIDGLELCEQINAIGLTPKIVILTGYGDFEYAKQAIKLNVVDYLMKPIGADELIKIMQKIKETIKFEKRKVVSSERDKTLLDSNFENIQHNYITGLMHGDGITTTKKQLNDIKIPVTYKSYRLLLISMDKYISKIVESSNYQLIQKIIIILGSVINKHFESINFYYKDNYIVSLINTEEESDELLKKLFSNISFKIKTELDIDIYGYYEKQIRNIDGIPFSYKNIMKIVDYRLFLQGQRLYTLEDIQVFLSKPDFVFPMMLEKKLLNNIDELKLDLLTIDLKSFFETIETSNITYDHTRRALSKLINIILEHLKYVDQSINNIIGYQFDPYIEFKNYDSLKEVKVWIQNLISNLVEIVQANQKTRYKFVIQKTIQYIENNFENEVSLKILSEAVYVTPNYLCKVFKEETGVNFKEWINLYRLDKAKDLLKNSYLKVYEVAEKSGYHSYKYFVQTFKKYNNCTPKQYRKKLSLPSSK